MAALRAGDFIEIDLGHIQSVDAVRVLSSPDQVLTRIRIDGMDASGRWQAIQATPLQTDLPASGSLGASAMSEIRARQIQYFFLRIGDYGAAEVLKDPAAWDLTPVDEFGEGRLYRIDAPPPNVGGSNGGITRESAADREVGPAGSLQRGR